VIVKVPLVGEGVEELTLVNWLVAEGGEVRRGDPIAELESDKVVTEFESPASGRVLRLSAGPGDRVRAGQGIAEIAEAGAEADAPRPGPAGASGADPAVAPAAAERVDLAAAEPADHAADPASEPEAPRGFLSPLARRLAERGGVPAAGLRGSGAGGRVVARDIRDYADGRKPVPAAEAAAEPAGGGSIPRGDLRPHTPARKRIAERMIRALGSTAPVLTVMEADLGAVLAHREAHKADFAQGGIRLTLTAYFLAAAAAALREHPVMNAAWTEEGLVYRREIDIGMAVSLGDAGLLVPVLRRVDELSLRDLAAAVQGLAERARNGTLRPDELRGGTFSVTNHGTSGSLFATPIMLQDQVGILGVGAVSKRPAVVAAADGTDALAIRPKAFLSLVFDHRAMDGEGADRFLAAVKNSLENWA
jgi:2-oxoglutarate dehydrogenase E2 component (dihydrolipoamide succinyltransferase)